MQAYHNTFEIFKKRDFGAVIGDTFVFVRKHFRPLMRAILIIVGPFLLLSSIYLSLAQSFSFGNTVAFSNSFIGSFIVAYLFIIIANLLLFTVLHAYVKCVIEAKAEEEIKVEMVWQKVKQYIWRSLSICLAFFLLFIFGSAFIAIIVSFSGSVFGSNVGAFMAFVIFLAWIYVFFRLAFIFPSGLVDDYATGDSFIRSWIMSKGYFWNNFGIAFIFVIFIFSVAMIAAMPNMILSFIIVSHGGNADINPIWKMLTIGIQTIGTILAQLVYVLPLIAYILQYFSAVEKTEGVGLLHRIENMDLKTEENTNWGEESY